MNKIYPVLITIRLGTGLKSDWSLRVALEDAGYKIQNDHHHYSVPVLLGFRPKTEEVVVNLVSVSPKELGVKVEKVDGDRIYGLICKRAVEAGLILCPTEVGVQFCLQLENSAVTRREYVIGMKPFRTLDGFSRIFRIDLRKGRREIHSDDYRGRGNDYCPHYCKHYLFINPQAS